jgi:preprotein translocase subunit SecE
VRKRQVAPARLRAPRFQLIGQIIFELKKAVWPTRQEVIRLTLIVIAISIAVGLLLGGFDYGFTQLVNDLFLGGG